MFIYKKTNCIKFGGSSLTLAFLLMVTTSCASVSTSADLILHNAKITTLNSNNPPATAVAIKDGRDIEYEGFDPEYMRADNADFAEMFVWFNKVGYSTDIKNLHKEFPEVQWQNFNQWTQ